MLVAEQYFASSVEMQRQQKYDLASNRGNQTREEQIGSIVESCREAKEHMDELMRTLSAVDNNMKTAAEGKAAAEKFLGSAMILSRKSISFLTEREINEAKERREREEGMRRYLPTPQAAPRSPSYQAAPLSPMRSPPLSPSYRFIEQMPQAPSQFTEQIPQFGSQASLRSQYPGSQYPRYQSSSQSPPLSPSYRFQ